MLHKHKKILKSDKQKKAIKKADKDYYFNKTFDEQLAKQEKERGKNNV